MARFQPAVHAGGQKVVRAFTLAELLVVIGIIASLTAILLPTVNAARGRARVTQCAAHVRQVCTALTAYASDHGGKYPPNVNMPSPGMYWFDADRIGRYLPNQASLPTGIGGGVLACPDDEDSERSYAMNIWASSKVDVNVLATPARGELWSSNVTGGSQMILVTERWSSSGSAKLGYYAGATVGVAGERPGQRFGAGGGVVPSISAGRFGKVNCELPFARHRDRGTAATGTAPFGRVNIGYADGHVSLKPECELVDFATGRSTEDSLWSRLDRKLNQ